VAGDPHAVGIGQSPAARGQGSDRPAIVAILPVSEMGHALRLYSML
jgi:hypothetical protein